VTVSQDMKTVYPQIETQAQVAGSRTRVVAEATLVVDKDKVWRDWNKKLSKFGRGTAAGVAAGAIVQGIVDGVGWIIDEGGKVTKKPTAETLLCSANLQSCYEMAGGLRRGSPESVCSAFNKKNGTVYHSATANTCYYSANGTKAVLAPIYKINPAFTMSFAPEFMNK
jgi:hypothetical protein